jgi:hypothetical protein
MPAIMTKTTKGAISVDSGQTSSMPIPFNPIARIKLFTGPMMSESWPKEIRPSAEARLKPDTRPAEANEERPIDCPYIGRKKGGTRRGNVASAEATQIVVYRVSRKILLRKSADYRFSDRGVLEQSSVGVSKQSLTIQRLSGFWYLGAL